MDGLKKEKWEESYSRKENFLFYPKEEVVKFLNRFVRKKEGVDSYRDIINLSKQPKALDLGCGIGRQTILLQEFGFDAYGVDISHVAIEQAKFISNAMGHVMDKNFVLLENTELPFVDDFFDIAISDSVLDSMDFSFARKYMDELDRTVKYMVYLNLISSDSSDCSRAEDVLVVGKYEEGTIQSYYDFNRINELIKDTRFEIIYLNINRIEVPENGFTSARFNIVLKKR